MKLSVSGMIRIAGLAAALTPAWASTFGTVVPIGGHIADLALDQSRGLVYAANFASDRVDVLSMASGTLQTPLYVGPVPSTLALSPDSRYLVVGHYTKPLVPNPSLTIFDFTTNQVRGISTGSSVLAVAFGYNSQALVVTDRDVELLDPVAGTLQVLQLSGQNTMTLPVPFATYPPQITGASAGVSGDGSIIYVLADTEKASAVFRFEVATGVLSIVNMTATPPMGPRVVSVNRDGSFLMSGWTMLERWRDPQPYIDLAHFPYPNGALNLGGHAFDYAHNTIYAQIPGDAEGPVLHVLDFDNLTVRQRIRLPQNLAGKALLTSDAQTMYAASDSGILILPVGSLASYPRVESSQEDAVFRVSTCDPKPVTQYVDIVDPGGGQTDFTLASSTPGVRISPAVGTTPARVQIDVDPAAFSGQKGTIAVQLALQSAMAVNIPFPIRLLVNMRDADQKGQFFNVPGKVVDIVADPARDRFYLIRQDQNQVLVFDGTTFEQIGWPMRTGNTPVQGAITNDRRYLIVTNENSQVANVYDLETLLPIEPIVFQSGYTARAIAVVNTGIMAVVHTTTPAWSVSPPPSPPACVPMLLPLPDSSGPLVRLDLIDFNARSSAPFCTLGIYQNSFDASAVLSASPSGGVMLMALPNGTVARYEALPGTYTPTFIASRKDFSSLSGAYATLTDTLSVVDNNLFDQSMVPMAQLRSDNGASSGFVFWNGMGLRSATPSSYGTLQRVNLDQPGSVLLPMRTVEAPITAKSLSTARVGQIGQAILPFTRSLALLSNGEAMIQISTSGFTAIPMTVFEPVATPVINAVTNAADGSSAVAPGGLIAIAGENLSSGTAAAGQLPMPRTAGEVCVQANAAPVPVLNSSPGQIIAQLPFFVSGDAQLVVRNAEAVSSEFRVHISPQAPAVFQSAGAPTVMRADNNVLVSPSNPVRTGDTLTIYATGLGRTVPELEAGAPSPSDPPASALVQPVLTLGGTPLEVRFAGLVPGLVGVYQINAAVGAALPAGPEIPLTIDQAGQSTTVSVSVTSR